MDKKIFGIKLSTYINLFVCFAVAFVVWFIARYIEISSAESALADFLPEKKYL